MRGKRGTFVGPGAEMVNGYELIDVDAGCLGGRVVLVLVLALVGGCGGKMLVLLILCEILILIVILIVIGVVLNDDGLLGAAGLRWLLLGIHWCFWV
jgi:hypothetical protein